MQAKPIDVVAAGHICLDIIPTLTGEQTRAEDLFIPGGLVDVGPATLALGGSVANTGLALHRLGAKTRFVGKVGDDLLGKAILESLRQYDASFPQSMIVAVGEATSYTIVLSPPQVDRGFLHCPGANDTFVASDLDASAWRGARILHFGYPPLMRGIAADGGHGLAKVFADTQSSGVLVSLDMAMRATTPGAAPVNWRQWLRTVLPRVDVFLPSYEEIVPMLASNRSDAAAAVADANCLGKLAEELLSFGVPIVVIKLGDQGLYLRTSEHTVELSHRAAWRGFDWQAWRNRELLAPCFNVEVVGTTGAGDCTIAGFLKAMLAGEGPEAAMRHATLVGAHCVQSADATSNIPTWSEIERATTRPGAMRTPTMQLQRWTFRDERGVYTGPADMSSAIRVQ